MQPLPMESRVPFRGKLPLIFRPEEPARLLIMLHGCTQNAQDFAIGTRMGDQGSQRGYWVVFPEQGETHHPRRCWNWYRSKDQTGGELAELVALVQGLQTELGLGPERTFLAGLSAGGAMISNIVLSHPELLAAFAVHSGMPPRAARTTLGALAAMKGLGLSLKTSPPMSRPGLVLHGKQDKVVSPVNGDKLFALLAGQADCTTDIHSWGSRTDCANGSRQLTFAKVGHAWSGGSSKGSHTAPNGPDATSEILDFFDDCL